MDNKSVFLFLCMGPHLAQIAAPIAQHSRLRARRRVSTARGGGGQMYFRGTPYSPNSPLRVSPVAGSLGGSAENKKTL